ncbi:MAG: STAS-like domain-containing protein [Patescibacteria group bacterium]|nr:STAS-like domain-containing protein [Patescibacteria group bacterium]
MKIQVHKFGTTLVSRPSGKEAWLAFQPTLNEISDDEEIIVDFEGVIVLTPSWADEFLTPLQDRFKNKVKLENINNPSVIATLETLGRH